MDKPIWVIFDVGGVIFDYQKAFQEIAKYLEIEKNVISEKVASYRGQSERGGILFEDILKQTLSDLQKSHEYENVSGLWWDTEKFLSGTKDLAIDLKKAGYKLAFLTNNWEGMADKILSTVPEYSIIDMIFESSKEGYIKPEAEFYTLVEKKTGAKGKEIYFIDDVKLYIDAAKNHNWQTFFYVLGKDAGKQSNTEIRKNLLSEE